MHATSVALNATIRKSMLNSISIEIIDTNAKISQIWLIEIGKLLLASKKNHNNNRKTEDIKKNVSNHLVLLLAIDQFLWFHN